MKLNLISTLLTFLLAICSWQVSAQSFISEKHPFQTRILTEGLKHPWGLAFLPDGRMLVTERVGNLRIINRDGKLDAEPVRGLPDIVVDGQGGLLDVALHPDYQKNGWIYLSYVGKGDGGYGTDVLRARLNGHSLKDVQVLFRMHPKSTTDRHFGSRLVFDKKGFLFITLGDRGEKDRAQKLDDHAGSVIRLHDDGSIPKGNPFVAISGAKYEKYTLGHRNLQGAALHPETGDIWTHEHGPQGGDEINIIRPGVNYGWPIITYGRNYFIGTKIGEGTIKEGMAQPVIYWTPSIGPSGMTFYTGSLFPKWKGNIFVGALTGQMLVRLEIDGQRVKKQERLLEGAFGRIRDVRNGPDGCIYLLTDNSNGMLVRVEPVP